MRTHNYLARIDALLDYIYKLETCIEVQTDIKLNKKYGKKYRKSFIQLSYGIFTVNDHNLNK